MYIDPNANEEGAKRSTFGKEDVCAPTLKEQFITGRREMCRSFHCSGKELSCDLRDHRTAPPLLSGDRDRDQLNSRNAK